MRVPATCMSFFSARKLPRLTVWQLQFSDDEGQHCLLHDYNNNSKCGLADTFLVVAWLVRMDPALQIAIRPIVPQGLDFESCPFEQWIMRDDQLAPLSNLLLLYHFLDVRQ